MNPKQEARAARHLDQIVLVDEAGTRHVANVALAHSGTLVDLIYQAGGRVQTAAQVPHRSVGKSGHHFIFPDEETK